jgi:hypothetical protein
MLMGALLTLALLIFLLAYYRRPVVTGTVSQNGEGVEGITVAYTINGKKYSAVTDSSGVYLIRGYRNVDVTIRSVGQYVNETLPVVVILREDRTLLDFTM